MLTTDKPCHKYTCLYHKSVLSSWLSVVNDVYMMNDYLAVYIMTG